MHPTHPYCYTPSVLQWSPADLSSFIQIVPHFKTTSTSQLFSQVVDLLKKQEEEIQTFPLGAAALLKIPATPADPLFYFRREQWLEAINKIEFWKNLPGGADYLKGTSGYEEAVSQELAEWILQRPEVYSLKQLSVKKPLTRLPPEIGLLRNLEVLIIMNTSIQKLPPQIGELTKLETLLLNLNRLQTLCPEFENLQSFRAF